MSNQGRSFLSGEWPNEHSWKARWVRQSDVGAGGQGQTYRVSRRDGLDARSYLLKELRDQRSVERRARMFREAAALASYSHPRIPRFVESNAHTHDKSDHRLYLVTEFVEGPTLASTEGSPYPFDRAIKIAIQASEIVEYLQSNQAGHRDIKPDNIIMREGEDDLCLVDFGLTFNRLSKSDFQTGDWQELGNRFLRLPELSTFSANKQDFRTDVAFLGGILFFLLFGRNPAILQDEDGRLPHQRAGFSLANVCPSTLQAGRLALTLDAAFQPRLSDRLASAALFRARLEELGSVNEDADLDSIVERLRALSTSEHAKRLAAQRKTIEQAWLWLQQSIVEISAETGGSFVPTWSGNYDPGTTAPYRNMGLQDAFLEHNRRFWLQVTCRLVADELVVTFEPFGGGVQQVVLRTDSTAPDFSGGDSASLRAALLRGIAELP